MKVIGRCTGALGYGYLGTHLVLRYADGVGGVFSEPFEYYRIPHHILVFPTQGAKVGIVSGAA